MLHRTPLALALAALALVPGCLSGDGDEPVAEGTVQVVEDETAGTSPALAPESTGDVPRWQVGQYWEYDITGGDGGTATLVVAKASSSDYLLLPTDEATALYDAAFDISFVGPMSARDLSGRQGDTSVKFFQFPLSDGLTWTTTWDGEERTITATRADAIPTPQSALPGFTFSVKNGTGIEVARYSFAPAIGWLTELVFLTDGEPDFTMQLKRTGLGYTGDVLMGEARRILQVSSNLATGASAGSFRMEEGESVLAVTYGFGGAAQAFSATLFDPSNGKHDVGGKPAHVAVQGGEGGFATFPGAPGTWQYDMVAAGPPTLAGYAAGILAVTFTAMPLGPG